MAIRFPSGKIVTNPQFDEAASFTNSLAWVKSGGRVRLHQRLAENTSGIPPSELARWPLLKRSAGGRPREAKPGITWASRPRSCAFSQNSATISTSATSRHRMDMTAATAADDWMGTNATGCFRRKKGHQNLGFDLEMFRVQRQRRPGCQVNEPVAGIGCREAAVPRVAKVSGSSTGSPAAAATAMARACVHAVANHQPRAGCPAHRNSAGKSSGACWPSPSSVTAHSKPCLNSCEQTGPERRALRGFAHGGLPSRRRLPLKAQSHPSNRHPRPAQGNLLAQSRNQRGDAGAFVETRNDRSAYHRHSV